MTRAWLVGCVLLACGGAAWADDLSPPRATVLFARLRKPTCQQLEARLNKRWGGEAQVDEAGSPDAWTVKIDHMVLGLEWRMRPAPDGLRAMLASVGPELSSRERSALNLHSAVALLDGRVLASASALSKLLLVLLEDEQAIGYAVQQAQAYRPRSLVKPFLSAKVIDPLMLFLLMCGTHVVTGDVAEVHSHGLVMWGFPEISARGGKDPQRLRDQVWGAAAILIRPPFEHWKAGDRMTLEGFGELRLVPVPESEREEYGPLGAFRLVPVR